MKRFSLLAVALVVALALMGIAYGLWSTMLQAQVTVSTGTVDAVFVNASAIEEPEEEGKDVGSCEAAIENNGDLLQVTIANGYPGYQCHISVGIKNNGTIPVKVQELYVSDNFAGTPITGTFPTGLCGVQIEPSEVYTGYGKIIVEQAAAQNATYQAKYWVKLVQWNEFKFPCPTVVLPWGQEPQP